MDPVSQGVLGGVAAQQFRHKTEKAAALLVGALAGMAPDLDVFITSDKDPLFFLEFHRHFTHALIFKPLPNEAITLTINGAQQLGDSSLVTGENCYSIPLASQQQDNTAVFNVQSGALLNISHMGIDPSSQSFLGLTSLTRSSWDERAVRKVLKVFAFGGHARSEQIALWANMRPRDAIEQMLNFDQHNARLSPLTVGERYAEPATSHGTITEFYDHIGSQTADTPIPLPEREYLGTDGYRFPSTFGRMVVMRGLNPFRQRIGFFETNYHMATNRSANVERRQMLRYYDDIMAAHEQRVPYHEVIGVAAKSAAVAMQYGHRRNICRNY